METIVTFAVDGTLTKAQHAAGVELGYFLTVKPATLPTEPAQLAAALVDAGVGTLQPVAFAREAANPTLVERVRRHGHPVMVVADDGETTLLCGLRLTEQFGRFGQFLEEIWPDEWWDAGVKE